MDDALVIDCDRCPMRRSTTCDDCVVGVLLTWSRPDNEPAVGLAPPTPIWERHREPATPRWPDEQEPLWR